MIAGLGINRHTSVELRVDGLTQVSDFRIVIGYRDVADKHWQTSARYAASHKRYDDITIVAVADEVAGC